MNYQDIITVEPGKRGGQPCIRGLRITVYDVLSYLASGMTEEEILSDFPDLTHEDILAALSYAAHCERAADPEIWFHARTHGFIVVTKDKDIAEFAVLKGSPPKIVWLRMGNCSTRAVEA